MTATRSSPAAFDEVCRTDGAEVILTPFRSPQANAHAERFVRAVRAECLEWLLILGPGQLDRAQRVGTAGVPGTTR